VVRIAEHPAYTVAAYQVPAGPAVDMAACLTPTPAEAMAVQTVESLAGPVAYLVAVQKVADLPDFDLS